MKNLGFGMMRLPVLNGNPTDFDYDQVNQMVDAFLEAGYTYFDTSYIYHEGKSEEATRKALVERHPRNSFTVATKFPTFLMFPEEKIEEVFQSQLDNLGVECIDYYLLHNIQTINYDGFDGTGGVAKTTHLFEHAKKWKEDGKIAHLGISFHYQHVRTGQQLVPDQQIHGLRCGASELFRDRLPYIVIKMQVKNVRVPAD